MRFHVVSLPHTQTTEEYSVCAYTEKVRKFCAMMKSRGHTVYLYAGEENEAYCDELITCISEQDRKVVVGDSHYVYASFDFTKPHWISFNNKVIEGIKQRAKPRDFICIIAGIAHKQIADAFPTMLTVEFGIGYSGTFSNFKVWESYAWMHTCYGSRNAEPSNIDGIWYDAVVPGYFEVEKFPFGAEKDDYYLFIGRLTERKGFQIAADVCKTIDKRLILAGPGDPPSYGEYVGVVGPEERGQLMSKARAVFVPTIYIEPFGNVAVEAMACGTPVITTDWGAFTETVIPGVTGYRCRTQKEFITAAKNVHKLNPKKIRKHAIKNYSLPVIAKKYEQYFERLSTLWGKGWYA